MAAEQTDVVTDGDRTAGDPSLAEARRARDRLLARATFWDAHRGTLTVPLIALGALAGYLIGLGLRALGMPPKTEFFAAVIGILAIGRALTWYFDPRKLVLAERRLGVLLRRGTSSSPSPSRPGLAGERRSD